MYQPGVTSVIGMKDKSRPLMYWAVQQCEAYCLQKLEQLEDDEVGVDLVRDWLSEMRWHYRDVAKDARSVGTTVHQFLHQYIEHKFFEAPAPNRPAPGELTEALCEQANLAIDAGMEFFSQHHIKPVAMETPVWSATHGYIGTDDFIGEVDGELCTLDWKTSKGLYPEVWLQTAAYTKAYIEEHPRSEIKARWGINIGKDGTLYTERRGPESLEDDFRAFLGLLEAYHWDRKNSPEPKPPIEVIGALPESTWLEELAA